MNIVSTPIALVTGASKRIGRAIALALAEDGFDLALHYNHSADEALSLKAEIEAMGQRADVFSADLALPEQTSSLIEAAHLALGPINLLINNASVLGRDSLTDMTLESWRRLIDVNLTSQVFLMQAFSRQETLPETASIINMLDQQMAAPSPRFFSYSVAKIGLEGATRLAAFELAPKVRVNGIAPGLVLRSGNQSEATFRNIQQSMPLGEGLNPKDIVHAVQYLSNASQVTGEVLTIDSGQHLIGPGNSHLLSEKKEAKP